ncbi:serine-type endopeptidase activity protein [Homalodisca vitripennis]|nr:serine-type endopeptidase activity protein [Homalodisca vitripennis]
MIHGSYETGTDGYEIEDIETQDGTTLPTIDRHRTISLISWLCGGSLISERFVLSAAHCSKPKGLGKARWVLLGAIDIRDKDGPDSAMRQQFQIVEHYVHKDYHSPVTYNDIVLFRLDRDVVFTWFVAPACLYQELTEPEGKAIVTGWGRNESSKHLIYN